MGGGRGNSGGGGGGGGGSNFQQNKTTSSQEEVTQKTTSDTNVPTEGISGPGGPVQNNEQKPNDFNAPEKRDPCLVKVFDTLLAQPIASALQSTSVGTVLTVKSRGDRLDVLNDSHEICGFITAKMQLLIGCAANDHKFLARIIAMDRGEVRVRVYNALDAA